MPADCWPVARPALVHADRSELLTLARTWDYYGALSIFGARELEGLHADEEVGLFCVNKDADYDRMIVNPTVVNGRMFGLSDASKGLSPGWLLGSLHLDSGVGLRFHAADLSDFYHSFQISHPRSLRNRVRARFKADELRGLTAFREGLEEPLAIGLRTLAMGDSLAVEVAQSAHTGLLQSLCGSMREGEVLKYREPVPRGSFIEALSIDDHICLQKLPLGVLHSSPDARDATTFRSAKVAYRRVGLHQNEKKDKVVCTAGTILGAELDGVLGVVSAPRDRVHCLCVLSSYIASKGFVTGELLDALLGSLCLGGLLFCLVDHLFREKPRASRTAPFQLGPHSRNELFLLSVLGGLAQSDLRATYHPELHCLDASPSGGAICSTTIGKFASSELWRHSEQKGYYTRLASPASAILLEHGIPHEGESAFGPHGPPGTPSKQAPNWQRVQKALSEGIIYDCVGILSDAETFFSCHKDFQLRVFSGSSAHDPHGYLDVLCDRTCRELLGLACRGVVREWHAELPQWGVFAEGGGEADVDMRRGYPSPVRFVC
eukprot:s1596_g7.t2